MGERERERERKFAPEVGEGGGVEQRWGNITVD